MPRQPQVHFRLKPVDENGKCTIYLQFLYNRYRLFYSFGQTVKPGDWNKGRQRVKKKDTTTVDGKFSLNELLDNLAALCEKTYNETIKNGIPTPAQLKKPLVDFLNQNHNDDTGQPTFFTLAERFINGEIKVKGQEKSRGSLNNYGAVTKHLKAFQVKTKTPVTFDSIDLDFFYKYVSYLRQSGLATNTIAKDISILKVFMGEAVDLGYTTNMQYKNSKFSFSEVETEHVYLTEIELNKLYEFKFQNTKMEQVKDLFIFGAWVGLRFSDFSNIKPENIVQDEGDHFIKIVTQKTKELVIIPCNAIVLEIFQKYHHTANKLPKTLSNQKFNDYIKDVCKDAGLNEKGRLSTKPELELWQTISSHTARRSFATNYYLQGFPTIDLMKITGHKTERAFLKYIRVSKLHAAKRLSDHMKRWSAKLLKVA